MASGAPASVDLSGKTAFISGAGRGIGRAVALRLAGQGMQVAFNYLRNRRAAEATQAEIEALGVRALALKGNVADPDRMAEVAAEVREAFGTVDLLVSNAASGVERGALELTQHHWHWTLDINAWGLLSLVQQMVPVMPAGSSVVAISSLGAVRALPYYTVVGASKAALESLARHLAVELGPRGIRVNVVSAGVVDTDALRHFPNRQELLDQAAARTPLRRVLEPADVADAVLFFASNLSRMVSGATLVVDGGYAVVG
jgi:enoyl-[acyl-carrier protein] reductase III